MLYRKDTNILILTDLHISDSNEHEEMTHVWISQCVKILEEEENIHYILILGDICNQGKNTGRTFIQQLAHQLSKVKSDFGSKFLIIPGNHDLNRSWIKDSTSFITKGVKGKEMVKPIFFGPDEKRKDPKVVSTFLNGLLENQLEEFGRNLFSPLVDACTPIQVEGNVFFGYKFDMEQRVCLFRFNSCWNAIDSETDNGKIIVGKNIVARVLRKYEADLQANGLNKKDITVITMIHHPPSWWCYEELYSSNTMESTTYGEIIRNTDILLSGHTHGTYTGYSFIYDGIPNDDKSEINRVLFIEAPATLTLMDGYYPTAITRLKLQENHSKIDKVSYVYNQIKAKFERTSVLINLPRHTKIAEDFLKNSIVFDPDFSKCNIACSSIAEFKVFQKNIVPYFEKFITKIMGFTATISFENNRFISENTYWIPYVCSDDFKPQEMTTFMKTHTEQHLRSIMNTTKFKKLNFVVVYRNRLYSDFNSKYIDFDDFIYKKFDEMKKDFNEKKYLIDRYVMLHCAKFSTTE